MRVESEDRKTVIGVWDSRCAGRASARASSCSTAYEPKASLTATRVSIAYSACKADSIADSVGTRATVKNDAYRRLDENHCSVLSYLGMAKNTSPCSFGPRCKVFCIRKGQTLDICRTSLACADDRVCI